MITVEIKLINEQAVINTSMHQRPAVAFEGFHIMESFNENDKLSIHLSEILRDANAKMRRFIHSVAVILISCCKNSNIVTRK
jgi:hypothetical protein